MSDLVNVVVPPRLAPRYRPRDKHGHVIPWFVHVEEDGTPDFRIVRAGAIADALRFQCCWICGQRRGRWATFVIGPMCAVNRVAPEPPSHYDCAEYAARVCPFLSEPSMRRRTTGLAGRDLVDPAGVMLERNPGVAVTWTSRTWKWFTVNQPGASSGVLFDVGKPEGVGWWCRGRPATRAEVDAAIDSGLPRLEEAARRDGPRALVSLAQQVADAALLLPAPEPA